MADGSEEKAAKNEMTSSADEVGNGIDGTLHGSLVNAFRLWETCVRLNFDVCQPCIVEAYDRDHHLAQVRPLVKKLVRDDGQTFERASVVVSVWRWQTGGFVIDAPIFPGDTGWLVASDRDASQAKASNSTMQDESSYNPKQKASEREDDTNQGPQELSQDNYTSHISSCGFFIPDRWGVVGLGAESADATVLREVNRDGTSYGSLIMRRDGTLALRSTRHAEDETETDYVGGVIDFHTEYQYRDLLTKKLKWALGDIRFIGNFGVEGDITAKPWIDPDGAAHGGAVISTNGERTATMSADDLEETDAKFREVMVVTGLSHDKDENNKVALTARKMRVLVDEGQDAEDVEFEVGGGGGGGGSKLTLKYGSSTPVEYDGSEPKEFSVPTPNNGTLTLKINGEVDKTFSANQSDPVEFNVVYPVVSVDAIDGKWGLNVEPTTGDVKIENTGVTSFEIDQDSRSEGEDPKKYASISGKDEDGKDTKDKDGKTTKAVMLTMPILQFVEDTETSEDQNINGAVSVGVESVGNAPTSHEKVTLGLDKSKANCVLKVGDEEIARFFGNQDATITTTKGDPGVGISDITSDASAGTRTTTTKVTVTLTDGKTKDFNVTAKDGDDGDDGTSVAKAEAGQSSTTEDGYTETPITFKDQNGNQIGDLVKIKAKNGEDAAKENLTIKVDGDQKAVYNGTVAKEIDFKQKKLEAGPGISLSGDNTITISATGSGGSLPNVTIDYVLDVKYDTDDKYLKKRMAHCNLSTGNVTLDEWEPIDGGQTTPITGV